MNSSQVNRRIKHFLSDLADPGTFHIRKKSGGHFVCIAAYGGLKRHFTLCWSPSSNYQVYAARNVNQFVRSLPLKNPERFSLNKFIEDL